MLREVKIAQLLKSHVRGTGVKGIDYSAREDSDIIELVMTLDLTDLTHENRRIR